MPRPRHYGENNRTRTSDAPTLHRKLAGAALAAGPYAVAQAASGQAHTRLSAHIIVHTKLPPSSRAQQPVESELHF